MRQSDRADMGPDANDPRGVCRVTVGLAARHGCSAGRLLANPGWGLRHKTFSLSPFDPPDPLALEQNITMKVGVG